MAKEGRAQQDEAMRKQRAAEQGAVLMAQMAALEESRHAEALIRTEQEKMRVCERAWNIMLSTVLIVDFLSLSLSLCVCVCVCVCVSVCVRYLPS